MRLIAVVLACLAPASQALTLNAAQGSSGEQLQTSQHRTAAASDLLAQLTQSHLNGLAGFVDPFKALATLLLLIDPTVALQGMRIVGSRTLRHSFPGATTSSRVGPFLATESVDGVSFELAKNMLKTPVEAAVEQQDKLRQAAPVTWNTEEDDEGTVYIVGVGPGDVELLSVKALRLMQSADIIMYDRLIMPDTLLFAGPQTKLLDVGKTPGMGKRADDSQRRTEDLMLRFAASGKRVVRLKGGDPAIFARSGEEKEYLQKNGVRVKIVPGITAASGAAASIGVPLTHRDYASSVRFISGAGRWDCSAPVDVRYQMEHLSDPRTTLAIYMGLKTLPDIVSSMIAAGLPADTPAVAVQDGTKPTERTIAANIKELPRAVKEAELRTPVIVLVGAVVELLDSDSENASAAITAAATAASKSFSMAEFREFRLKEIDDAYSALDSGILSSTCSPDVDDRS